MTDMYVYYFMRPRGPAGALILSKRRATLEAIKGMGEAVMESQMVVDHREVDDNGFVIGGTRTESDPTNECWSQIRSLELRANSRDDDAQKLEERSEGALKYMLQLESRELRCQAQRLKMQLAGAMSRERENAGSAQNFIKFAGSLMTR
jgi:hypothetical protein